MKVKLVLLAATSLLWLAPVTASAGDFLTCRMIGGRMVGEGCKCRIQPKLKRCGPMGAACLQESVHYDGSVAIKRCCVKWTCRSAY